MKAARVALLLAATAAAATFLIYSRTLGYGFDYDDYHFIHPYTPADVERAFRGPWDAAGIELPYYRPLTIAFFAARFELLGVNSAAHHALSLMLFAVAVFLVGWFVFRITASAGAALLAALLAAAHPAMPYSAVAWVTNQMHLLETIVVLSAICWWLVVRRRPFVWWTPLLAFATAAFLLKEDGIMLLPCVIVLHGVHRRFAERDLPRIPAAFVTLGVAVVAALLLARHEALHGLVSRRLPSPSEAFENYWSGLYRVFCLAPVDRPWQRPASWFAVATPLAGLIAWRRAADHSRSLVLAGASIALLFNLPFVFVTKAEQLHLVAVGASIVLAGSARAVVDALPGRAARLAAAAAALAGAGLLAAVTVDVTRDFEPFGPIVLSHDGIVGGWAAVPEEIRDYLAAKRQSGAAGRLSPNPAEAIERVTFGVQGHEKTPDGVGYRWMAGTRTEILLSGRVRSFEIPLRHAIEVFREPVHATIEANGRVVDRLDLATPEWRVSRSTFPGTGGRFTEMQRLVITIDRAWRPSEVIPGSQDGRLLGLQLGEMVTRAGARR